MHNISNYASICDIYHMDVRSFSVASCSSNSVYFISTSQNGWQLYREAKFFFRLFFFTASHLPYNRNGLKFFTSDGGLNKADIKDILEHASKIYEESAHGKQQEQEDASRGVVNSVDYMSIYASDLVQAVRKSAGGKGAFHVLCLKLIFDY